jgi:LuxR family maltose regulon positive regulatory protein
MRLSLAQRHGDLPAVIEESQRLLAPAEVADTAPCLPGGTIPPISSTQARLDEDVRALALVTLGTAELWALQAPEAERHLELGGALARRAGRPWLEVGALANEGWAASFRSFALATERFMQAIELAREHGWIEEPVVAVAYVGLGAIQVWQMRLDEAEASLKHAERAVSAEVESAAGLVFHEARGMLELARGRDADALATFQAAGQLAGFLVTAHPRPTPTQAHMLHTLVRLGETERVEQVVAGLDHPGRGETRTALAALRVAQGDPEAAAAALAPVLDGSAPVTNLGWMTQAFVLEAIAREALGDQAAARHALEHALDLAEPDGAVFAFVLHPAPELLQRHARHGTAHAALISEILNLLAGSAWYGEAENLPVPGARWGVAAKGLTERLTDSETRVLRYLPTNLAGPEIARELSVSVNTVRTHMRHLYEKLGAHSRTEAVERARVLRLLAPSLPRLNNKTVLGHREPGVRPLGHQFPLSAPGIRA